MSYVVGPAFFAAAPGGSSTPFDVTIGGNTADDYGTLTIAQANSVFPDSGGNNPSFIQAYGGERFSVLRFGGISDFLAAGSGTITVSSAILRLYLAVNYGAGGTSSVYDIYRDVLTSEMTHNRWRAGNNWETPGALGSGDRSASALGSTAYVEADEASFIDFVLDNTAVAAKLNAGTNFCFGFFSPSNYADFGSLAAADGFRPSLLLEGSRAA